METQRNNTVIAGSLFLGLIAIAGVILVQSERINKTQAIDGCLKLVQVDRKAENGDIVSIPENYWYNFCMDKKGYDVTEKKTEEKKK